MRRAQIPIRLAELTDELEALDARREEIIAERVGLWQVGYEQVDPPFTQKELADPCRLTDGAVTQALRRARKAGITNGMT